MPINKITAPLATSPSVFAAPVITFLQALVVGVNIADKNDDIYIKQGAMFCIGGSLFIADSDTSISGSLVTTTKSIKFTVSGDTASAEYSDSGESDLTWNGSYHGYYDSSDNYYLVGTFAEWNAVLTTASTSSSTSYTTPSSTLTVERSGTWGITIFSNSVLAYFELYKNGSVIVSDQILNLSNSFTYSDSLSLTADDYFYFKMKVAAYTTATITMTLTAVTE